MNVARNRKRHDDTILCRDAGYRELLLPLIVLCAHADAVPVNVHTPCASVRRVDQRPTDHCRWSPLSLSGAGKVVVMLF